MPSAECSPDMEGSHGPEVISQHYRLRQSSSCGRQGSV